MRKKLLFLALITSLLLFINNCGSSFIEGEYYIEKSNTKIIIEGSSLLVKENNIPVYNAVLTKKTNKENIYTITEILLVEIMEEYKKPLLNIKNKIKLSKSDDKNKNQEKILVEKKDLKIIGNFFGEDYIYELSKEKATQNLVENTYLRKIESNKIKSMKFDLLTNKYETKLVNSTDKNILRASALLFDKNKNTSSKIPLKLSKKVGLEFSLKIKDDDNENEEKQKTIKNKKTDKTQNYNDENSLRAVKITIPEEEFFKYCKPAKLKIFFSSDKKHNPGFRVYLYEKVIEINLKNEPGEQIFYIIDAINNPNSIYILVEEVYEGLNDKVLISDIDFFIE